MDKYYPADSARGAAAVAMTPATEGEPSAVRAVGGPGGERDTSRIAGEYHINRRSFTTDSALLSLTEPLHVSVDDDGRVQASRLGKTNTFVPVEPGVYRNVHPRSKFDPYGTFSTIVFQERTDGRMLLLADGPMSYSKVPLYSTSGFTFGAIVASVLMFAGSLVVWMFRGVVSRGRRQTSAPVGAKAARGAASLFGAIVLLFLGGVLIATDDIDPALGVPTSFFGIEPTWASALAAAPPLLLVLAGLMVIFTVVAWVWRFWSVGARVHYTVLTMAAAVLLAVLKHWHVI